MSSSLVCVCVGYNRGLNIAVAMDIEHKCRTVGSQMAGHHSNNNPGVDGSFQVSVHIQYGLVLTEFFF